MGSTPNIDSTIKRSQIKASKITEFFSEKFQWVSEKIGKTREVKLTPLVFPGLMCGVSLKDRKRCVDLYSLLGVQSVDEVVRQGRLRWFGHVERKSGDDWVSACRNVVVAGVRCAGRGGRLGMNV